MAKQAIQRFIRDDKGNAKVVLIDAQTLQPVQNPAEYEIINGTQLPYWEPVQDVSQPDVPSKVQPPAAALNRYIQQSGGDPTAPAVNQAVQTHAATQSPQKAGYFGDKVGAQPTGAKAPEAVSGPSVTAASEPSPLGTSAPTPVPPSVGGIATPSVRSETLAPAAPSPTAPSPTTDTSAPKADMSVTPETKGMASLVGKYGKHRPEAPSTEISDKVREAAAKKFGPDAKVVATSGTEGNLPQYGSNRHKTTKAMDFHIEVNGQKVTDPQQLKDFAEEASALGVIGTGIGNEYMGPGTFHMDTVPEKDYTKGQTRTWASQAKAWTKDLKSAEYLGATSKDRAQPHGIPQNRPNVGIVPDNVGANQPQSVSKGIISAAKDVTSKSIQGDPTKVSPAQMAGLGLMTHARTPDQISRMAAAISGEMLPDRMEALAAGDEAAKKELAGIVTTMENRIAKAKSFDAVLDPSQYNSLMDSKAKVTKGNYAKYGQVLRDTIPGFYTGDLKPESYDDTSYHNKSVSPAWGIANTGPYGLKDAKQIGDHTFGSVKDRQNPGTDLSGRATGPTEGGAGRFGAGGLGSGLNSPSESNGSRFGGQGLGGRNSDYSGREGKTSGPGLGLGGKSTSNKSSKSDKDKDKSQGPSGGGYGGWGGPR